MTTSDPQNVRSTPPPVKGWKIAVTLLLAPVFLAAAIAFFVVGGAFLLVVGILNALLAVAG